jgi:type I restriction enzyme R subunit
MNKKELTETDIRTKFIIPALVGPATGKWDLMIQVCEGIYFTKGRVINRCIDRMHKYQAGRRFNRDKR